MTAPAREALEVLGTVRQEALSTGVPDLAAHMANYQMTLLGDLYADYDGARAVCDTTAKHLRASGLPNPAARVEFVLALVLIEAGDLTPLVSLVKSYDESGFEYRTVDYAHFARLWLARATGDADDVRMHMAQLDMGIVDATPDMLIGLAVNLILSGVGVDPPTPDDHQLIPRALAIHADDAGSAPLKLLLLVGAVERDFPPGRQAWRNQLAQLDYWQAPAVRAHCAYADAFLEPCLSVRASRLRAAAAGFERTGMRWWAARARLTVGVLAGDEAAAGTSSPRAQRSRPLAPTVCASGPRPSSVPEVSAGRRWRLLETGCFRNVNSRSSANSPPAAQTPRSPNVLSQNTVARHLTRIYRKLGVRGRADAIAAGEQFLRPE